MSDLNLGPAEFPRPILKTGEVRLHRFIDMRQCRTHLFVVLTVAILLSTSAPKLYPI